MWVRKNLNAALREFGEVGQCLRVSRLVVDNNDLQVWIIRVVQQAFDTGVQQLVLVTCGYDQADTWQLLGQRPVSPEQSRVVWYGTDLRAWGQALA
ncbi:hypothetical protein D3C81_1458570 [compost metagenome]